MEQSKFYQIKNITEYEYTLVGCDGSVITRSIQDVDKSASTFTIQDAKDGDVLADDYGIYIFDRFDEYDEKCFLCMGAYQYSQKVYENEHMLCSVEVHPATKEQRDLLFKKMKEAGYEWDAEKKELRKIEQPVESVNGDDYSIDDLWHAQRILEKTLG